VTLDLGNIVETTNGESVELSTERSSNTLSDARFTDTRRTAQTDDLSFHTAPQFADCEELQDTVFDVFQTIVIVVED